MLCVLFNLGKKGRKKKEKLFFEYYVFIFVNKFYVYKINYEIEDDLIWVWKIVVGKMIVLLKER